VKNILGNERAQLGRHTLSSTETIETNPNPEANPAPGAELTAPEIEAHEHAGHDHEGHDRADHDHQHGPSLNPDCTREVEVDISASDVSKAFRSVVKRYQKQARIPGFRSGKVPESLIRTRFAESIRQDVIEQILPDHFRSAIEAQNLKPVSQPQVTELKLEDGQPLHFRAAFEVMPSLDLAGYQDVTIQKPDTTLTDAEFDAELERVRESRSTMEPVTEDRGLVDGDWAQITFTGQIVTAEGDAAEAETKPLEGQNVDIEVGGANTLPAFNESLRDAKPGQELKFEVSYPADFNDQRLAGKTVSYDVEVKGIKKKIQPELNDDLAKELGDYPTMDDFKQKLREHMANDKRRRLESDAKDKLLEALIQRFEFPVPETLVQAQIDARLDRGLRALAQQGMRAEDMRKLDFNRLRAAQRDSATSEVKGSMVLDHIADMENINVAEDEVEQELQLISLQTGEPQESLRTRLTGDGGLVRIREQLRRQKTGNTLYERLAS
jgi:trigger factor